MKKIYDCFTFFNELDILDIRLNELAPEVDFFVIVESTMTFKGAKKALIFEENKARYAAFAEKLIHVVVRDLPVDSTAWKREEFQRNAIRRGLTSISNDDVVLISDADEIIRQEVVAALRHKEGVFIFDMPMYQFYLNMEAKAEGWQKAYGFSGSLLSKVPDFNQPRIDAIKFFDSFREKKEVIKNAGWHFTFLGGAERVREKLKAYSHAGDVVDSMINEGGAERQILLGRQVGNISPLSTVPINSWFPNYIQMNEGHFRAIGFIKDLHERVRELESLRSEELHAVAADIEKRLTDVRKAHDFAQQRRSETGKKLAWMTGIAEEHRATLRKVQTICEDSNIASEGEKIKLIMAVCSAVVDK